jgi:predicted amidohydrolase
VSADQIERQPTEPIAALLERKKVAQALSAEALLLARLREAVSRANALFDLEPIPIFSGRKTRPDQIIVRDINRPKKSATTKIALVSIPTNIYESYSDPKDLKALRASDLVFERFDHFDLCLRHPKIDRNMSQNWCGELLTKYRRAAQARAELICANELSFPSFWTGRAPKSGRDQSTIAFLNDLKDMQRREAEFERQLQDVSKTEGCVILPGTYHDPFSFENVAPVIFPYEVDTIDSRKYTSAHSAGESIKVSRLRKIPVYAYGNLVFSVLICSDAFDLNIFFRYMIDRLGPDKYKNQDIIFVPSYYQPEPGKRNAMLDACKQLSWATGSVVVFVNCYSSDGNACKAVFMCGEEVWSSKERNISYFTIDWRKFHGMFERWLRARTEAWKATE